MSDLAIRVEGLSKQYQIGGPQVRYRTIRESIVRGISAPVRRVSKLVRGESYGAAGLDEKIWALNDVSFDVHRGEVIGLIGRNGAGKTTLLKILSRITKPTEGMVTLHGRVGSLLEVGTGFHPELTGRENIVLNGAILGMRRKEIDRRFDEIVDFSEIGKFIDTPVKHFSSGMHVRLAFAVAAHLEPEILLVDEVLAVGDAGFQRKCLGKMGDVASRGRTVVFVSHNMAAVESLCTRSLLIEQGRIIREGPTQEVIAKYLEDSLGGEALRSDPNGGIIRRIVMKDDDGAKTSTFRVGESIFIEIYLDTLSREIKNPRLGIGFNNHLGQRMFTVGTYFSRDELPRLKGKQAINCEIATPNLVPGDYTLKIAVDDNTTNMESLENAAGLRLVPGDYFGSGKLPNKNQGPMLVRSKWGLMK